MINGTIESYQSKDCEKLLSPENIRFLYDLGKSYHLSQPIVHYFQEDSAISQTQITHTKDNDGRKGNVNKTVIIKFDNILVDIIEHTDLLKRAAEKMANQPTQNPLPTIEL